MLLYTIMIRRYNFLAKHIFLNLTLFMESRKIYHILSIRFVILKNILYKMKADLENESFNSKSIKPYP